MKEEDIVEDHILNACRLRGLIYEIMYKLSELDKKVTDVGHKIYVANKKIKDGNCGIDLELMFEELMGVSHHMSGIRYEILDHDFPCVLNGEIVWRTLK